MCPTLLGQAHKRNGIFTGFGIGFDKKFDNGFDKTIWEKIAAILLQDSTGSDLEFISAADF